MKMTIGRKLAFPFFLMFILIAVVGGITYQGFHKFSASLDNIQFEAVKRGSSGNLRFNITQLLMANNDYILTQKKYYQHEFDRLNLVVDNFYNEFSRLSLTDEEQRLLVLIKQDLDSIRAYSAHIFSISNPRQSSKASSLMETMDYSFGEEINKSTTQIFDGISKRVIAYNIQADAVEENLINLVGIAIIIGLVLTLIISFITVSKISKPVVALAKAAEGIANGDYLHRVVVKTHDEVALLAKSFNKMAESIQLSIKALEESKRFVESIIEAEPECVCVVSQDGKLQSINPAGLRIIDADTPEQVIGKTVDQLIVPEHLQSFQNLAERVFMGEGGTLQFEIVGMKGRRRWLETNSVPIYDEAGHIIGNLGINRDITERKLAEEFLLKFRMGIEKSSDAILLTDPDGTIVYVNPAFENIFGYSKEEAIGKTPRIIKSGISSTEYYKNLWNDILTKKSIIHEIVNKTKDGRLLSFESSVNPVINEQNEIIGFLAIERDITKRKRMEETLLASESKFRRIFESDMIGIIFWDVAGNILDANSAFLEMVKYNREEVISGKVRWIDMTPPEYVPLDEKALHEISERGICTTFEKEYICKDGSRVPILIGAALLEGVKDQGVAFILDNTERKRGEEEIISQKNRFVQLFENSPIAIALLDEKDKVVHINESFSALFGYYLEEIRGKFINGLIVPNELKEEAELYSGETRGGSQISKESYRRKKDGTIVYVQIVGVPVIVNDKTVGIYGMYVDLTQRKDAEDKMKLAKELAEQSDKLKTEFLAQMSHEVRTPLNAVLNYSNLIKSEFEDKLTEEYLEVFEGMDHEGKRITRTIDAILNISQLQAGTFEPLITSVSLGSNTLPNLIKEYSLVAKAKNLDLRFRNLTDDSTISADQYCVDQIFSNLIDNAIKFADKGFVEIRVLKDASNVIVEVEDSGIGISNDFIAQLFEPFTQEYRGYSRKYEGNGLGLALVKRFCEINNASIEVESKKNKGSTFRVKFNI